MKVIAKYLPVKVGSNRVVKDADATPIGSEQEVQLFAVTQHMA